MLHKGKLQAALNFKRVQFDTFDDSFSEQLNAYRQALETLYARYPSSTQLEHVLPPDGIGMPSQCAEALTGAHIPQLDALIITATGKCLAI